MNKRFVDRIIESKDQEELIEWFHRLDMRGKLYNVKKTTITLKKKIEDQLWDEYRL